MPNNPDITPPSLCEIGFHFDNDTSLIGIPVGGLNSQIKIPRVTILQPEDNDNKYDEFHTYYGDEIISRTNERQGVDIIQLFRGDIYRPETLAELPPAGFFVLENVLSDPYYKGEKDFESLVDLLSKILVSGGIVLTLDTKLTIFSDGVKDLIQSFLDISIASGDFTTLLNLLDFEWGIENIEKRNSKQVKQRILKELKSLDLVDQPLKDGLEYLKLGIYHCLVLQKN